MVIRYFNPPKIKKAWLGISRRFIQKELIENCITKTRFMGVRFCITRRV